MSLHALTVAVVTEDLYDCMHAWRHALSALVLGWLRAVLGAFACLLACSSLRVHHASNWVHHTVHSLFITDHSWQHSDLRSAEPRNVQK